ncbi:vWA domain-containing protein [Halanaerobacter jeridensis]|uniref:Ca-activated chloride channel family protein n=1 Tax=Halanaerobacter jeridensis TaxID=706427 RepID=A0A939BQU5_9FIRM|nr:vWA domain-containing protein [Halanaerobacter jeridensis]MBM7556719.1 Ca-activated chloride channel family protein [Halanaerobacter jeridensis]
MRLKQNLTLGILIIVLISGILTINMLNILSFSKEENPEFGREIKVNNQQLNIKEDSALEIIWDVSGSMWGEIDNKNKITIAKEILEDICGELSTNVHLGLRIFGSKNNKGNSFLVLKPAPNNNQHLLSYLAKVTPAGKSPIGVNLLLAKNDLIKFQGKKHILLITDGKDTGKMMPTKIIKKLKQAKIKTHIVHVGEINKINQLQLKTLAQLGNGKYFTYFEYQEVVPTINLE